MTRFQAFTWQRARTVVAIGVVSVFNATRAPLPSAAAEPQVAGRIDFGEADLPPPTVEVDLSRDMFRDVFSLGDAALAGVAESLRQSADENDHAEGTRLAAEQLAAARQLIQLASEVVREVRVRVYRDLSEEAAQNETLAGRFDEQLRDGRWNTVVRVSDAGKNARISLLRDEGAVRGVFVVAGDGRELVLANIVCDVSPENVKRLSSAATTIGLENGMAPMIEMKMRELKRRRAPVPPPPPSPERPDNAL